MVLKNEFIKENFLFYNFLFYNFLFYKNKAQNAEKCTPGISFYKFIKENSNFPFITGVNVFGTGVVLHKKQYTLT